MLIKKGLVFGKFMPPHKGHLALIAFAASQCEQLVVSMSVTPTDPIEPALRFAWLQEIFKDQSNIEVVQALDDFSDDSQPIELASKEWAVYIKHRFPDIEAFFCSETYGEPLARHLGLPCVYFDISRTIVPVSSTQIRQNPPRYWDFLPEIVRPYFVKKVCLFGPESVGKTTTARQLAQLYDTAFVHEVSRDVITTNDFSLEDIITIGHAQTQAVQEAEKRANKILFCDTDVVTTQIYSEYYLHEIPPILFDLEKKIQYDLYFLLDIDVPWVADGLRDLGHKRKEMYEIFKNALEVRGIEYLHVSGDWATRIATIKKAVKEQLGVYP